jgi:hypothetical protein
MGGRVKDDRKKKKVRIERDETRYNKQRNIHRS